jgi:hypothetical protein
MSRCECYALPCARANRRGRARARRPPIACAAGVKQFEPTIAEGKLLLIVDVPEHSVEEVKTRLGRNHPEAVSGGTDPHIPAFR